jgi:putative tricarboxylic transport membrane protein
MTSRKVPSADRASALVFLAFAIAIGIEAYRLGLGTLGNPGPGLTPFSYASVLGLLSMLLYVRSRVASNGSAIIIQWRSVLPILAILLAYGLMIEWLGYILCTFVAMVLLFRTGGVGWIKSVVCAAIATLLVHLLFVRWLAVPLPIGSIFP